jgi:hypothetical protein
LASAENSGIVHDKHARDRLALLGDRVLSLHVTEALLRDKLKSAGDITMRKQMYEAAASHAGFLVAATNAEELFGDIMCDRNEHSLSSLFEAFVGILYQDRAHASLIDPFVAWCDKHIEPTRSVSLASLPRFLIDFTVNLDTGALECVSEANRKPSAVVAGESLRKAIDDIVRPAIVVSPKRAVAVAQSVGSWYRIAKAQTTAEHPAEPLVAVRWDSHKYSYRDFYYPCCSRYKETEQWIAKDVWEYVNGESTRDCGLFGLPKHLEDAVHPGKLQDFPNLRRYGYGIGLDHVRRRGQPAIWSCCLWAAGTMLPGCQIAGKFVVKIAVARADADSIQVFWSGAWHRTVAVARAGESRHDAAVFVVADDADSVSRATDVVICDATKQRMLNVTHMVVKSKQHVEIDMNNPKL